MFGALPVCPTCQFGKLRVRSYDSKWLHEARGSYFCPGNRDASGWQACPFKAETVTRAAWHAGGQPTGGGAAMGASPMGGSPMGASSMGASAAAAAASPAFAASPYAPAAPPAKRPRLDANSQKTKLTYWCAQCGDSSDLCGLCREAFCSGHAAFDRSLHK